jgi:hypothetical protein
MEDIPYKCSKKAVEASILPPLLYEVPHTIVYPQFASKCISSTHTIISLVEYLADPQNKYNPRLEKTRKL